VCLTIALDAVCLVYDSTLQYCSIINNSWYVSVGKYQEVGHWLTAAPRGVKMGIPYLIPNITLGSFGAVTQVFFLDLNRFCVVVVFALLL
jgi:hypothetical protein